MRPAGTVRVIVEVFNVLNNDNPSANAHTQAILGKP
jgi:hypothetical protein